MITIVLYRYLLLTSAAPVLRPQKEPATKSFFNNATSSSFENRWGQKCSALRYILFLVTDKIIDNR